MNTSQNANANPADDFEPDDVHAPEEVDDFDDVLVDHDNEEEFENEFDDESDDEYDDEEYYDEDDEEEGKPRKKRRSKSRVKMHCFNCNRPEGFFIKNKGRWLHSYLLGFSFGLINLIGPFKCQCCGASRFMRGDMLHPKRWVATKTPVSKAD